MDKDGKRNKLIGKIILADFLEYRLEKFINFVSAVEKQPLYKKLSREGIIIRKPLSGAKILSAEKESVSVLAGDGVIAKIKKDFFIYYTNECFSVEYIVDNEKLRGIINDVKLTEEEKQNFRRILHKLRRINTRNLITHEILKGIVEYQSDYFESKSDNDLNLKLLSRLKLARTMASSNCEENSHSYSFVIDASRISRVTQGLSIITPQGKEVSLKSLLPTKRDIVKRHIKVVLNKEKGDICNGKLKKPYIDEELRRKLNEDYELSITRREVAYCRKELGILPYSERVNSYGYPPLLANYSKIYPFTSAAVKNNAPTRPGVYELRLNGNRIEYPGGCCQTFYIGSAKNLRKRLLDHLSPNSKNEGIKGLVKGKRCVFRYIQVSKEWGREERILYNLFVTTFGDSPVCNHVAPKANEG
ncbi:hypothetical protein ES705_32052 [subsurface metagenome]